MTNEKEHTVPEVIWATPMDGELWEGTFTDKGKLNADAIAYTLKSTTDALITELGKQVNRLTVLLDSQLGTPCEQIRHQQEQSTSDARIAELEVAIEVAAEIVEIGGADRWGIANRIRALNDKTP